MFILGTRVHNITLSQALKKAEGFLHDTNQHYIVTPNPEIVLKARKDAWYRSILNKADLSIPDGTGLVMASRLLRGKGNSIKGRVAGSDFMMEFLNRIDSGNVLLLGGRNGAAKKSALVLQEKFPGLKFYSLENIDSVHAEFVINSIAQPACIFVALGAPKQERWIHGNLHRIPSVRIAMGVGGAFDYISGRIPRAPGVFQKMGLEWLWRLVMEPWRVKRVINAAVIFPVIVIHSWHIARRGIIK